jgi:hypothetical protein
MKFEILLQSSRQARWFAIALLAFGLSAGAQTVRPLIDELGNPAKGRVEYVNDASVPLNVTVEAKSFSVSESGEISYRPLDPRIRLKFSTTSFRIPPQQSYFLFYEASTDETPAWFVIYASFSGFGVRTEQGMNIRVQLPHTVYLLPKQRVDKPDVRIVSASYDPATNKVKVVTENGGPYFGRVQQAFIAGGKKRQEGSGFPVFPKAKRQIEYDWKGDQPPEKVTLEFEKFKIEGEVTRNP